MVETRAQSQAQATSSIGAAGASEIAEKSASVTSYMNNGHKESLAYLVTHHADLLKPLPASQVEMVSIDAKKVTLRYSETKGAPKKSIEVRFYPSLRSYEEVRPRFVELCQISERVVKGRKPLIVYRVPKGGFIGILALLALYAALRSDTLPSHPLFTSYVPSNLASQWNSARSHLKGKQGIDKGMLNIVQIHLVEAIAMLFYASYRGASQLTAIKWAATQFVLGFPTAFIFLGVNSKKALARRAVFGYGADQRREHH